MSLLTRRWVANLAGLFMLAGMGMLERFSPATSTFYPRCLVFTWLHLYCPGCGGTRALAALLHGRPGEAMHWNAMVVIFLPFAIAFLATSYWRAMRSATFVWPTISNGFLKLSLIVIGIFTLVRNLPSI